MGTPDARPPVLGLVLTGGKSTRMGSDKAALDYGAGSEADRLVALLNRFCSEVFVSCRPDQQALPGRRGHPQIHDVVDIQGPLAGILSAFEHRSDVAWLVVACDLPLVDESVLTTLIQGRDPSKCATAFRGFEDFPEPLCTLYEPQAKGRLHEFWVAGYDCPRKMLINSDVKVLGPVAGRLMNVNTPEEVREVHPDFRF